MTSLSCIYNSENWIKDIDEVSSLLPELSELGGKSVLITGAAGLICSAVVDILIRYNETHSQCIDIYAAGRSEEKMRARFGEYSDKDYFRFVSYDANADELGFDYDFDFIIHGASNAFPEKIKDEPVETMLSNFIGTYRLLDYAKKHKTKRFLYVSSSEVYGLNETDEPIEDGAYGYIDILNPRSSYSCGKRSAETLCASFYSEYGIESVIVRPGHIYGPTASPADNRVSSAFIYKALRREDIVLKSDGSQIRSYCYCPDCASAIIKVLLKGENLKAYNISNSSSIISIKELSGLIASISGVKLLTELPDSEEKKAFNPMKNSSLNSAGLEGLGWKGLFDAERGLRHTYNILKETFID